MSYKKQNKQISNTNIVRYDKEVYYQNLCSQFEIENNTRRSKQFYSKIKQFNAKSTPRSGTIKNKVS